MKYESKEAFEKANIFGTGTANTAYAQYFIGNSFLNPLTDPKSGLEENNPVGEKFDPHKHQAMAAVPSDQPANTVLQVFQKGYSLEGRVLRPALVSVAQSA